jgi:hypothetical protein
MTQRSLTYLKAKFETGDIPTQSDYQDVFDSFVALETSGAQSMSGPLTVPQLDASRVSAAAVSGDAFYAQTKIIHGKNTAVSAAGTTQASATRITTDVAYVLANDNERSVVMATCEPGRVQYLTNTNTTTISVFPASGGNFIGTAENAALLLVKLGTMVVIHHTASAYGVVRMQGV